MAVPGADRSGRSAGGGGPARSRQSGARAAAGHSRQAQATLKCQFDAFAGYVAEAERHGVEKYPLYKWTKATIENPAKKAKYLKSFTLYVDGNEVYAKDKADALESDLQPLVGGELVTRLAKHDTNPANNPQPPARYRK